MFSHFKLLILMCCISVSAFADDELETQLRCSTSNGSLSIAHLSDFENGKVGVYQVDVMPTEGAASRFEVQSADYFTLMDVLWLRGEVAFEDVSKRVRILVEGAPYLKRSAIFTADGSPENITCHVTSRLPIVSCATMQSQESLDTHIFHFRHGSDLGTTTGYYISRKFLVTRGQEKEFSTQIVGAFSLNKRLLQTHFKEGKSLEFKLANGNLLNLDQWKSPSQFEGNASIEGKNIPIMCEISTL